MEQAESRVEALRRLARQRLSAGDVAGGRGGFLEAEQAAAEAGLGALADALAAERLLAEDRAEEALARLEACLREAPDNRRARGLLGEAQRRLTDEARFSQDLELHVCAHVGQYRRLARELPGAPDVVIELGAAEGHATLHLARRAARVIAVEQSAECLARARERCARCENVTWLCQDAFEAQELLAHTPGADLVFVDIGGSTWPSLALRLGALYRYVFRPRGLVIRNVGLNDFVAAVKSYEGEAGPGVWRKPSG
jgi:predicted O-methyltransferase YrrM